MPSKQIVYSDRLVGLNLQNGLVRMDLAVNAGTGKGKDDKPVQRMEITTQVVMPLDAFANAVAAQEKLLKELIARDKKAREAAATAKGADTAGKDAK